MTLLIVVVICLSAVVLVIGVLFCKWHFSEGNLEREQKKGRVMNDQPRPTSDAVQRGYRTLQTGAVIAAVIGLANAFGWLKVTAEQQAAVIAVLVVLQPLLSSLRAYLESRGIITDKRHRLPDPGEVPVLNKKPIEGAP